MQDKTILYSIHVDSFLKRLIKILYPYIIIPSAFAYLPFLSENPDNIITGIWLTLMFLIIIMMMTSSYSWTYNQLAGLTLTDDIFEIEIVIKNTRKVFKVDKYALTSTLKWQGGRPRILKLTLFDNNKGIADFYSGGRRKMEYVLEDIAYKINSSKTPVINKCLLP